MLGRAVERNPAPPPKSKNDLAKQLFPSSSPSQNGNIEDGFKNANARRSIGGFVGATNFLSNPLNTKSPNITASYTKTGLKTKSSSMTSAASSMGSKNRSSSLFSRADSFQDSQETFMPASKQSNIQECSQAVVGFDENDFDSGSDLELDYQLPGMMAAPPKPPSQKPPTINSRPKISSSAQLQSSQNPFSKNPSSGAISWSSSPPSHYDPPSRQQVPPPQDLKPEPREKKRRNLPWAQKRAEEDEIAERQADAAELMASKATSSSQVRCFKCNGTDHLMNECPEPGKAGKKWEHNPGGAMTEKKMPWNNTFDAVKAERKLYKDKHRFTKRRIDEDQMAAMEQYKRRRVAMSPISLSDEQKRVQDLVINESKSVFFTGSAGTGKSVLMRSIIQELRKKYVREPDRVAVTASTGLAACNIGGVTLHSFGGIGLGKEDVTALVKKIKRNPKAKNRWIKTKVLIIDEISMVDGDLFDKLEGIARAMRNNGRPFGGIQLVITGDFFQLPPVPDYDNKSRGVKFAFDAGTWNAAIHHTIGLTEVFRQKDPVFANMLNEMRLGKITDETVRAFKKLNRELVFEDGLNTTELFPTRNEVDNANARQMRSIVGKSHVFEAIDSGAITDEVIRDKLLANMMAPKLLEVKKGAQVMLIKNMDDNLVNGSLGIVVSFMSEATFDIYTVHPEILDYDPANDQDVDEVVLQMRARLKAQRNGTLPDTGKLFPLVRFSLADGTSRDILIQPEEWKVELPNGEVQAQRTQLPLILAWALSIHKAQGQTLERVKIDLKKIFEKGQAYVALSRATSQAGLVVYNFEKSKVMAHPRVAEFYNSLYSVNKALEHPKVTVPPKHVANSGQPRKPVPAKTTDFDEEQAIMLAYG